MHWGSTAEIVTALGTAGLALVAYFQFRRFNKQVRADFTYKVYQDLYVWLNAHPQLQQWVDDPDGRALKANYDAWGIDDYLTHFETVWSLWRTGLVDRNMVYDLVSEELIASYEANDCELERIIRDMQQEGTDTSDVYIGVQNLYGEMKRMTRAVSKAADDLRSLSWG